MSALWGVPDSWATSIDGSDELAMDHKRAQITHLNALSATEQARSKKEGMEASMMEKRMQVLSQRTKQEALTADNLETQMMDAAQLELDMGSPDKAALIMNRVAQIGQHKAATKLSATRLDEAIRNKDIAKREDMYNIFSGIDGPEAHQQALMMIQGKYPDEPIPAELREYNPALIDHMKKVTKTGLERAKIQLSEDREGGVQSRHEETVAERRKLAEWRETMRQRRQKYGEDRKDARVKVGGDKPLKVGDPNSTMIKAAEAMVRKDYPDLAGEITLGQDQVSSAAFDIASEAKALMSANRGISSQEAMSRVYKKLKDGGAFSSSVEEPKGIKSLLGMKGAKKDVYRKPVSGPVSEKLPPKGTPLVDGKVYDRGDGTIFKWDAARGKGIVLPGGKAVKGAAVAAGGPDEDDGEEE